MTSIGLPVPPGFTITTEVCDLYYKSGRKLPAGLMDEVATQRRHARKRARQEVRRQCQPAARFGSQRRRRLDAGHDEHDSQPRPQRRSRRRPGQRHRQRSGLPTTPIAGSSICTATSSAASSTSCSKQAFDKIKAKYKVKNDTDVPVEGMIQLCDEYKKVFQKHFGKPFPQDPLKQLELAIEAVFKSWMIDKAVSYRRIENITGLVGTAVNCQSMVFGNMGDDSGTGVAFTRDPATGENKFYGEFLINAQGEDVVAGIRTPLPVEQMPKWNKAVHKQLLEIKDKLESHYRDVQDIEFTIEKGTLFMLQTRNGKRTGAAAVKIACDMVKEKLIDEKTAVLRIPAGDLTQLLAAQLCASRQAGKRRKKAGC